jgi:hypothetical protein
MRKAAVDLDEAKESILNAYKLKTGLTREALSALMDEGQLIGAVRAVELGFCDGIIGADVKQLASDGKRIYALMDARTKGNFARESSGVFNADEQAERDAIIQNNKQYLKGNDNG